MIHKFDSQVQHGKKLGRTLGFPTINCPIKTDQLTSGTYKVNVIIGGNIYSGVGPYFQESSLFEIHLFGFNKDCYEEEVTIIPLLKIRENKKFSSLEELNKQIKQDCQKAQSIIFTVMTFGTFDHFHKGHEYYLHTSKQYGDRLVTIIARDTTVKHVKSLTPAHQENKRRKMVEQSGISDFVELGDTKNYYTCLIEWKPNVICLGYDQHSFDKGLKQWYKKEGLEYPEIIRIDSFSPDQYKSSLFRN